jgi:cytochrome P450
MTTDVAPPAIQQPLPSLPGLPHYGPWQWLRHDPLHSFVRAKQYGDLVEFRIWKVHGFIASHPELIQHVLVDGYKHFGKQTRGYNMLRKVLGQGLLTAEGALWQRQRRIANPSFRRPAIAAFADSMVAATEQMLAEWQPALDTRQPLDVAVSFAHLTLDIVCRTLLSADVRTDASEVGQALTDVLHQAMDRLTGVSVLPDWVPTPSNRAFQGSLHKLDTVVRKIIADRRASNEDKPDLLHMLLTGVDPETGEVMDDTQVRDEVMTIFLAGHETTAATLAWTIWLLGHHADVRLRLQEELDLILAGRRVTVADLAHLPLLRGVVNEALRLYPPAWILARSADVPVTLGGVPIPQGAYVFFSIYALHRDPRFWDDPERFWPERWDDPKVLHHKSQYLPFSSGGRKCIGDHFALMEAQLVLATLLQKLELRLVPGQEVTPRPTITLRPSPGVQVTLHSRSAGGER